jgi:hypothetical protein
VKNFGTKCEQMQILSYGADLYDQVSQHRFAVLASALMEDIIFWKFPIILDHMLINLRWAKVGLNERLTDGRPFK